MNKYLLAIDPSLRSTGVALFLNEKLVATDFFKTPTKKVRFDAMVWSCEQVLTFMAENCNSYDIINCVVEEQVRREGNEKMSMDDFVRLASLSYMIIPTHLRKHTILVKPSTWKGSVDEDVMANRLYNHELMKGTDFHLISDVQIDRMHAIGLGRWWYFNKGDTLC